MNFPVQEAKGLIFVFIGDLDPVPPLSQDVPPGFLDDDVMILGKHRVVNSNWRLGAENGFDALHIFIHKDTTLRHYRTEYARKRTQDHVARFTHLYRALTGEEELREDFLREFEERDNIFPEIDYTVYR
jgi:phenylpropionate dioxygenase-like ring-hydroxylating dioxygenase large terminal subunit